MTMIANYKQFFTPQKYSQYLIQELSHLFPHRIIDLAMGTGSLLEEAHTQWPQAKFFGNDIDERCCKKVSAKFSNISCFNYDIFKYNTIDELSPRTQPIDLCLGNPPFDLIVQDNDTKKILQAFNLDHLYSTNKIPAEIVFILQCLRIVAKNGTIALILPNGFFVNTSLQKFREFLLKNYQIEKIIDLPDRIFTSTDAKTHILVFKNTKPTKTSIPLTSILNSRVIYISHKQALHRMDYNSYCTTISSTSNTTLKDLTITIFRGKVKYKLTDINSTHILHTTNFSSGNKFTNRLQSSKKLLKHEGRLAEPGDIILARVGSYCMGNVGIVNKGYFVATDCVFVIRIKDEIIRQQVFNQLQSIEGQDWIKSKAKGVAAKHITLEDIKMFPIIGMSTL